MHNRSLIPNTGRTQLQRAIVFTGSAQTDRRLRFSCTYGEGNRGLELCAKVQMRSFASNQHAESAVDSILKPLGLKRNFVLVSCPNIKNAGAVTFDDDGIRYIFYDNAFMANADRAANTDWASMAILAHEIGHHLNGHTTLKMHQPPTREELERSRRQELEADEFSGFAMLKLGATLAQAQAAMHTLPDVPDPEENYDHPKRWRRLEAIKSGYDSARSEQPVGRINNQPTAETYFSEALTWYWLEDYPAAIEKFTASIGLNPKYAPAYFNRGVCRGQVEDYTEAIRDYSRTIQLDSKHDAAWNNRGYAKLKLGDKEGACEDFFVGCMLGNQIACKNSRQSCDKR